MALHFQFYVFSFCEIRFTLHEIQNSPRDHSRKLERSELVVSLSKDLSCLSRTCCGKRGRRPSRRNCSAIPSLCYRCYYTCRKSFYIHNICCFTSIYWLPFTNYHSLFTNNHLPVTRRKCRAFSARSNAQGGSAITAQKHRFFVNFCTKGTHFRIFSNVFKRFRIFSNATCAFGVRISRFRMRV